MIPGARAPWKLREGRLCHPGSTLTFPPCPPTHPTLQPQNCHSLGSSAPSPAWNALLSTLCLVTPADPNGLSSTVKMSLRPIKSWEPPAFLPLHPDQTSLFTAVTCSTYYAQHSVSCFLASLPTLLDCELPQDEAGVLTISRSPEPATGQM